MTAPPVGRIPKRRRQLPLLPLLVSLSLVLVLVNIAVIVTRPARPASTAESRSGALAATEAPSPTASASSTLSEKIGGGGRPRFGVFVGTDPKAMATFAKWLGRPIQDAVDFSHRQTWSDISDPQYLFDAWRGTPYRLIYAVPMLPDSLFATKEKAMRAGANGAYDQYFTELATNLVTNGQEDAVLRIGWEFNLKSWAWGIQDHEVFVDYFRHVVTAMRSVPGQQFNFNWNPNNGFNPYDATDYWPGNVYVDSIGLDVYDVDRNRYPYPKKCSEVCREQHQQTAWDEVVFGGPRGLSFWTFFAQQHHKPFSLPEWSMWDRFDGTGGGDDPLFLGQMQYFIQAPANNVSFAAYFNLDSPDGHHVLQKYFPLGAKRFRKLFGAR